MEYRYGLGYIKHILLNNFAITGGLLIFSTYLALGSLAFWFMRSSSAIRIGYDIHKFAQYPLGVYGRAVQIILLTILPYAFANYFPIAFLLGKVGGIYAVMSPLVCMIGFGVAIVIWKTGLKRYESSGS